MRLLALAASAAVLLCLPHATGSAPGAYSLCVVAGPLDVMGQQVVPQIVECAPVA